MPLPTLRTALCLLAFAPALTATDWSSVADGKTDAAPLLEAAFRSGGSVTLPKGLYRLSRPDTIPRPETGWAAAWGWTCWGGACAA